MKRIQAKTGLRLDGTKSFCLVSSFREDGDEDSKTPIFWYEPAFLSVERQKELVTFLDKVEFKDEKSIRGHPPTHQLKYWGDKDYIYARTRHKACPMPNEIAAVRDSVLEVIHSFVENGIGYKSVLANKYRNQRDSIGRHKDDPTSLAKDVPIAGVNVGCAREMKVFAGPRRICRVMIQPGSLYWFHPSVEHSVEKVERDVGVRYNLTFREHN